MVRADVGRAIKAARITAARRKCILFSVRVGAKGRAIAGRKTDLRLQCCDGEPSLYDNCGAKTSYLAAHQYCSAHSPFGSPTQGLAFGLTRQSANPFGAAAYIAFVENSSEPNSMLWPDSFHKQTSASNDALYAVSCGI